MVCAQCGAYVAAESLFCGRCGAPVDATYGYPPVPPTSRPAGRPSWLYAIAALAGAAVLGAGVFVGVQLTGHAGRATVVAGGSGTAAPSTLSRPPSATASSSASPSPSPSATSDFATIYRRQQSGVVRIEVLGCSGSGIGTGFLLSPTLVATVDHVVTDSVVVSLIDGEQRTTGQVIGSDPTHDLALVRATTPLSGFHFRFAAAPPSVGDRVAAIGFPIGDPITLTQGGISGLDRSITVEGQRRSGLIETDAPVNPGNSGGPLLETDGSVVGLVDALRTDANGIAYAVPATQAQPQMASWEQAPESIRPASCAQPTGPSQDSTNLPAIGGLDPGASDGIVAAFQTYFDGINTAHYDAAWNVLSPRLRGGASSASFAEGVSTSYDFDQTVLAATQLDAGKAEVALEFTSIQAADKGPNGDTCDVWTLVYTMVEGTDGSWYIDATKPYHGVSHTSCG